MSAPRSGQAPSRRRPSLSLSALPTYQPPLANSGSSAAAVATADGPKPSPLAASARPPPSIGTGPSSPHASRRRSRTPEPTPTFQRHWQPFVSPLAARPAASASFSVHLDEHQVQLEQQVQQVVAEVLSNLDAQKTTLQATFLRYAEEDRAAGRSSDGAEARTISMHGFRRMLQDHCGKTNPEVLDHIVARIGRTCSGTVQYLEMFKELVVDHIVYNLDRKGTNLRILFKKYDFGSYGYITVEQFRQMMTSTCQLSQHEIRFLIDMVDEKGNGRIDYRALFHRFYQTSTTLIKRQAWMASVRHTIRNVIVVVRHGARFPLKPFPQDGHWPKEMDFWRLYGGRLTPVGTQQLYRLGQRLRTKYILQEQLLEELAPDLSLRVRAYTSNQDRTLMSAQSLLLGMFPGTSARFVMEQNHKPFAARERQQTKMRMSSIGGLPIHMTSADYTPLLHGHKNNPAFTMLRDQAFANGRFEEWASDENYIKLVEKMYRMTGFKKIGPDLPMVVRLQHLQSLYQQVMIERAHEMELFYNMGGETIDVEDEARISMVAEYICQLRYQGLNPEQQRRLSRLAAGTLPASIVQSLVSTAISADKAGNFTLYSAHDNTLLALLSHFGFRDFPTPAFAAHAVLELHEVGGQYFVKFFYNPNPQVWALPGEAPAVGDNQPMACTYVRLPTDGKVVAWSDVEAGVMTLEEFEQIIMADRQSYQTEHQWREASQGRATPPASPSHEPATETDQMPLATPDYVAAIERGPRGKCSLKPFNLQVAGHKDSIIAMGDDRICKPMVAPELAFYECLFSTSGTFRDIPRRVIQEFRLFLPRFYGQVFISEDELHTGWTKAGGDKVDGFARAIPRDKSDFDDSGSRYFFGRHYTMTLPKAGEYRPVDFAALKQKIGARHDVASESRPTEASEAPGTGGWAMMSSSPDDDDDDEPSTWERRWVIVHEGILFWYDHHATYGVDAPNGAINVGEHGVEIVGPYHSLMRDVQWPTLEVECRMGILAITGIFHPIVCEDAALCAEWLRVLQLAVDQRSLPGYMREIESPVDLVSEPEDEMQPESLPEIAVVPRGSSRFLDTLGADDDGEEGLGAASAVVDNARDAAELAASVYASFLADEASPRLKSSPTRSAASAGFHSTRRHGPSRKETKVLIAREAMLSIEQARVAIQEARDFVSKTRTQDSFFVGQVIPPADLKSGDSSSAVIPAGPPENDGEDRESHPQNVASVGVPEMPKAPAGQVYIILENVVAKFKRPCILDLKLGVRQHTDDASPEKRARQIAKCANTTSHSMGIRCCGMHVFDSVSKTTRVWDKHYGRKLNQATFRECLYRFFDNGLGVRWAVIEALYAKLLAIISTVEQLKGFRFYSSSLLIAYNGLSQDNDEPTLADDRVEARLIDFARTQLPADGRTDADAGYLFGLRSLARSLEELREEAHLPAMRPT